MRRFIACAAFLTLLAVPAGAGEATHLVWKHRGLSALATAAAEAKQEKHRLLLGLSGGDT